jgi:hypothetical protein
MLFDIKLKMTQEVPGAEAEGIAAVIFLIVPRLKIPFVLIKSAW